MTEEREQELARFRAYQTSRSLQERNELVASHIGLARSLARRFAGRGEPIEDLEQVAYRGSDEGGRTVRPGPGDELRGLRGADDRRGDQAALPRPHVGDQGAAAAKELATRLAAASEQLTNTLGRAPRVAELAEALGVSEETVIEALDARAAYRPTSLAAPADGEEGRTLEDSLGDADRGFGRAEARVTVARLLEGLPARERRILELRYYDELSQDEIAARIGISQMHVSRLLRRVIELLGEEQDTGDGATAARLTGPADGRPGGMTRFRVWRRPLPCHCATATTAGARHGGVRRRRPRVDRRHRLGRSELGPTGAPGRRPMP